MLRSLTAIGIALALAGSAHAQEHQVAVSLHGKSPATIRTELHRAAEEVCGDGASAVDPVDTSCVEATYEYAMRQARGALRPEPTAFVEPTPPSAR